jgi:hypothetical protein
MNTVQQDTGLSNREQNERSALAHYWALRVVILMDTTGCSAQLAVQAIQDAMQEHEHGRERTAGEHHD